MPIENLFAVLPEAILAGTGTVMMLLAAFLRKNQERWCRAIAFAGLAAAAGSVFAQQRHPGSAFEEMILVDPFSIFFHLLFLLIVALIVLSSSHYLRAERLP